MPTLKLRDMADEKLPFPIWLRELIYIGGIIVALTAFQFAGRSDQRSTREEVQRMAADIKAIRESLPNREVYDMKLDGLQKDIDGLRSDLSFEAAKSQNLREKLLKKGWVD